MKEERDYTQDLAEIRSMMERSSKFLSLSGWSGILAGLYALIGAYIASALFHFNPERMRPGNLESTGTASNLSEVIGLALVVLVLAVGTAVFLSHRKAGRKGETIWNATSRRLLTAMAVPLLTGGLLILILASNGLIGLMAPLTLLFYGLAIYSASRYTYEVMKYMGLIQIILGLLAVEFIEYGLLFWAAGFGLVHIIYGIYVYYRYER